MNKKCLCSLVFFILITTNSLCYCEKLNDNNHRYISDGETGELFHDLSNSFKQMLDSLSVQESTTVYLGKVVYFVLILMLIALFITILYVIININRKKSLQLKKEEQFNKILKIIRQHRITVNSKTDEVSNEVIVTDNDIEEMLKKCIELGEKIDNHTNRSGNSKNISEIVFKIARKMNLSDLELIEYFCASMIYDIGFLSVQGDLFMLDILSNKERFLIKSHVTDGINKIQFINPHFISTFENAIKYHHENYNGSGYPEGLKSSNIPLIARIIRVAESYISLVSKRAYHKLFDRTTAITELRKNKDFYDSHVVDILETVV